MPGSPLNFIAMPQAKHFKAAAYVQSKLFSGLTSFAELESKTAVITSEMVTNKLLSHGEVLVNGDAVRARQVANQIALRDAIEKYGVKNVFTFHRDVKSAQSFVSAGPEGVGTHLNGDGRAVLPRRPDQNELAAPQRGPTEDFQTFHVNGSMPTAGRAGRNFAFN